MGEPLKGTPTPPSPSRWWFRRVGENSGTVFSR